MFLSAEDVKYMDKVAEEEFKIPEMVLMESAGEACIKHITDDNFIVVCGTGNNGGDGLVIARHLKNNGKNVKVFILGKVELGTKCFRENYENLKNIEIEVHNINEDLENISNELKCRDYTVIDCLYGIGLKGKVRGIGEEVISIVNSYAKKTISIDIPSGMECNTGETYGCCIKANKTITFEAKKVAFKNDGIEDFTGDIVVEKIGIPDEIINRLK